MDDKRVADYFAIAGLPDNPSPVGEFSRDGNSPKTTHPLVPITDITVIIRSQGEMVPKGYSCIETTPFGFPADLNHGSLRSPNIYLCYRRGRDKPPLVDVGVLYDGKERVMADSEVVLTTPYGRSANVNNSGSRTFLTYRRAPDNAPCNQLVVTDIRIILANKGEQPPRAFCLIEKNLNKGVLGSDVFLSYKKSMNRPDLLCFKPAVLGRFPLEDYENFPMPQSVPLFCLPMGATIECWPKNAQQPKPVFSTFVLTSDTAEKVYGAAVTFYEKFPESKLSDTMRSQLVYTSEDHKRKKALHAIKSICILSRWPFFDTFEKYLRYLHRMSISGPHRVPLERIISHFMLDVPFPSPQRPRILIQLADCTVSLAQPEDTPLPLTGASFVQLLRNLGPDNCLKVLLYALTEQKMLFHSLRPDVLTSVAEAVVMLIFPFHWQCPYIPLCPLGLSDVLCAPLPFIVGVDSRYFDLFDPPHDVTCVDLDTNSIFLSEEKRGLNVKLLPKRPARILRNTLQSLYENMGTVRNAPSSKVISSTSSALIDYDFKVKKKEHQLELEIQEAFLRFMSSILKGYRSFLLPITTAPTIGTTDPNSLFDLPGFLKSRDKTYHRFFALMMKTQMFIRFIEERSFVSDKDASLAFFDECTEKVDSNDGSETKILEVDDSQQSDRTVFIAPPEPIGLPPGLEYTYKEFGSLKPQLFHRHPAKSLLSVIAQTSPPPNSPMARRTKQEIKSAQKMARKQSETPVMWAKCLAGYCFSLWFIHLPSYVKSSASKSKALRTAFDVLVRMQLYRLSPPDEVCYRVLMLLCGLYSQPTLAVKVLFEMKRHGVQPNAITYGYYNKAVLESKWPSADAGSTLMWNRLRNVIIGVAQFRQGVKKKSRRSLSLCSEMDYDRISRTSTESSNPDDLTLVKVHNPTEFVSDLVKLVDDQSSSGGQSDGGYSSMNHDEVTKISPPVHSSPCIPEEIKEKSTKFEKHTAKDNKSNGCKRSASRSLKFKEIDFTASDAFRSRVGSIVRSSATSIGSLAQLQDATVDSAAGILMTSQASLLDDCAFEDDCDSNDSRRRHKSAGDHCCRRNHSYRLRHCSGPLPEDLDDCDTPSPFLRSYSFGNDVQIIRKIREAKKEDQNENSTILPFDAQIKKNGVTEKKKDEKEQGTNAFGLSRCDEESETELDIDYNLETNILTGLPRPRSPNIPIKQKNRISDFLQNSFTPDDSIGALSSGDISENCSSKNSVESGTSGNLRDKDFLSTTFSPLKEAWLNLDFFSGNSIPRMASNISYTLGLGGSTDSEQISSGANKVTRSSTFHNGSRSTLPKNNSKIESLTDLDINGIKNSLSRSSTLPVPPRSKSLTNKLPGTRTPGKAFSVSSSSFGLSRLTSKHSEVLLDSLKSAVTSVSSKFNEIRSSLSASNTPTKGSYSSLPKPHEMERILLYDDDEKSSMSCDGRRVSVDFLTINGRNDDVFDGQDYFLKDALWGKQDLKNNIPHVGSAPAFSSQVFEMLEKHSEVHTDLSGLPKTAIEINMTTCSRCFTCSSLLYDEEIMEGWSADDSNLNTQCNFCKAKLVPLLTVTVRDFRWEGSYESLLTPAYSTESVRSAPVCSNPSSLEGNALLNRPRLLGDRSSTLNSSIDSNNEAFILLEDSPDNVSLSNSHGETPFGSPQKQYKINRSVQSGANRTSSNLYFSLRGSTDETATDLIKLDSPIVNSVFPFNMNENISDNNANNRPNQLLEQNNIKINTAEEALDLRKDDVLSCRSRNSVGSLLDDSDFLSCVPSTDTKYSQRSPSTYSSGGDIRRLTVNNVAQTLEPITVPYLSPLVLRKEVENVLEHEGDNCMTKSEFVDQHPIIYWNLVWFFKRIGVPSHLPGLCLLADTIIKGKLIPDAWQKGDGRNVVVHCCWDNVKLHEDMGQPLYMLWTLHENGGEQSSLVHALVTDERKAPKSVMKQVLARLQCNDLYSPINMLINERRKCTTTKKHHHSIYREILFLSFVAIGRENIDNLSFDVEYRRAYGILSNKQLSQMQKNDKPPSEGAVFCRRYFKELELKPL